MDLDKITDIEILRKLCKYHMVQLTKDIITPTRLYEKGKWYHFTQDNDGIFIYLEPQCGVQLTYDEASIYLDGF